MKHTSHSSHTIQEPGWECLGEQHFTSSADIQDEVSIWLASRLQSIHLHMDLLSKLLVSAGEAVRRAIQAASVEQTAHLHILVFIRSGASAGQTWGFFRIEKIEDLRPDPTSPGHAIVFYLYPEGH